MTQARHTDEQCQAAADLFRLHGSERAAAKASGMARSTFQGHLKSAAERGMLGTEPVLPGFRLTKTTAVTDKDGNIVREFIQQRPESGETFEVPDGHRIKGVSALVGPDGRELAKWVKTAANQADMVALVREVIDEFKTDLPRVVPTKGPEHAQESLLNQYTITDLHFGMLASGEENRTASWDLKIAEKLLVDWFSSAIAMSPDSSVGLLAQIGDMMHHDSLQSVTPQHKHVLDADSRLYKIIRVVIRVLRQVIAMMLEKHPRVHIVMASGNHDEASSIWMRELLATVYSDEPRVTVDVSPDLYYAYEWGRTALFYHHGHKRNVNNVDTVFAGKFREIYGRCSQSYGHVGHFHNDEVKEGNLMKIERHRTLAAPDAHSNGGGWLSGRDAKVITYHKQFGEVYRSTLSPEMVAEA